MFTIEDIKTAHAKVQSGADFPAYIREIAGLGVTGYETFVADGHVDYVGKENFRASSPVKYGALEIAPVADAAQFNTALKAHQRGETDYPTFCSDCARAGVQKWIVDIGQKTCTYFDQAGNVLLEEKIPV